MRWCCGRACRSTTFRRARGKGFKIGTNAVRRAAYARRLFPEVEIIHLSRRGRHPRAQARQWRDAAAAGWRRGGAGGRADHGALRARARRACRAASPTNFRSRKCCRRWGRASSRSNAPRRTWQTRQHPRHRSTIPPRMPAPTPSARCCGCSTATAIRRSRALPTIEGAEMSLTASVLDHAGGRIIEASRTRPRRSAARTRPCGRAGAAGTRAPPRSSSAAGRDRRDVAC